VKSKSGNHIYFLIDRDWDNNQRYIVMADVRKNENADIKLMNGHAYNSSLTWESYLDYFEGRKEPNGDYGIDGGAGSSNGDMFDTMYDRACTFAMYAYLDSIAGDEKSCWTIDRNSAYMGSGFIADVSFSNGRETVSMLIDVYNKTYSVLDESITASTDK